MLRGSDFDEDLIRAGLAVKATGLTVGYGHIVALSDIRFEARVGEVTVVSGPAGAGKTSLLRVLRLALAPREGGLFLFGVDATKLSPARRAKARRRIGVMEDQPLLVDHWSAADNVALPLLLAGKARRDVDVDVADLLGFVGVGAEADAPVAGLSAAQRKQVALARALAAKPTLSWARRYAEEARDHVLGIDAESMARKAEADAARAASKEQPPARTPGVKPPPASPAVAPAEE